MISFQALLEIWVDGKIQYIIIEIGGNHIPKQMDIEARESLTEVIKEGYTQYTVLDLIGIMYKGNLIWQD